MGGRFRVSTLVAVVALLALIAVLATLQYHWLGQISGAERDRMKGSLNARATAFAQDLDRELTRAYLTFQIDPVPSHDDTAIRVAARYDRWQATARYPRLVKEIYLAGGEKPELTRFNPSTRVIEPADWPKELEPIRAQLTVGQPAAPVGPPMILRTLPPAVMDTVPALVVPTPFVMLGHGADDLTLAPQMACTILVLDRDYLEGDLLPALARQHFRGTGDGFDYQLAVVRPGSNAVVYRSEEGFSPSADAHVDASVDMFQVRLQEFAELTSEARRFSAFLSEPRITKEFSGPAARGARSNRTIVRHTFTAPVPGPPANAVSAPLSIVVEQNGPIQPDRLAALAGAATARIAVTASPRWRLLVKHPSGSLERAVDSARRRNLVVSSGILTVLALSVGFLITSTRRAHALARQQMEFVATVSHELRTPLAVIRSAGDNLADGVVNEDPAVRQYGELVRSEGRRLSELVEQVLEYAGLEAGERPRAAHPVALADVLADVASSARALAGREGITIDVNVPDSLPVIAGDEPALRRVFQNLIGNAVKYGAGGRWVGVDARAAGDRVEVTISDRGMGIAAADQGRIFDPFYRAPDVVAAQIQGAGLGLSLVKRIVEAHRGRVTVKSTPGAGSVFVVELPTAAAGRIEAADGVSAAAAQHS